MRAGGSFLSLSYLAGERVIPGYGGGMSWAKAALESDTRMLAYEAGRRHGLRINTISAGPYASRAASAIGIIDAMVEYCAANSPLPEALDGRRGRRRRRLSVIAARQRHHGRHDLRGQGLPRDGHGGRPRNAGHDLRPRPKACRRSFGPAIFRARSLPFNHFRAYES